MKIILVGANGTLGKHIRQIFQEAKHEVISVGRTRGDFQVDLEKPESISKLFQQTGEFDALVCAAGDVAFAPFKDLTLDQWNFSFRSKLLGQIQLVQQALPYIRENGSFTLISGILADSPIFSGVAASTVNKALEGFVRAAACELPKGLRINLVSPTVLKDSLDAYADFFPGFPAVDGLSVAMAFQRSVMGIQTGQVFHVNG